MNLVGTDSTPSLTFRIKIGTRWNASLPSSWSLFARENGRKLTQGTLYFATLAELLTLFENWQPIEASTLYQWNLASGEAQPFVTLIARNVAPIRPALITLK